MFQNHSLGRLKLEGELCSASEDASAQKNGEGLYEECHVPQQLGRSHLQAEQEEPMNELQAPTSLAARLPADRSGHPTKSIHIQAACTTVFTHSWY